METPSTNQEARPTATAPVSTPSLLRKWGPLMVLSLALAIIIIDTTVLNVSLSTIIRDLNTDIQGIQWVITAYSLMLAAFTITGGRLGDLFGRKKMFVLGAGIFAVGSLITSLSHSVGAMIAGEAIIEGIGAALMLPATASLLVSTYKGRDRAVAFGVWGGIAGAASAAGPIFGGYLTTNFSWRYAFLINIVIAVILIISSKVIKEAHDQEEKPTLDWGGVALSSLGLFFIVFGFIKASTYGWWKPKAEFSLFGHLLNLGDISIVPYAIAFGVIILAAFLLWEKRMEDADKTPLVSLSIFRNKQFTTGVMLTGVMALGQSGVFFALPVFFQTVNGLDAFHTGLALLPLSLTVLIVAPLSAVISKRISAKLLIQIGMFINLLAPLLLWRLLSPTANQWHLAPGLMLYAVGMGLVMSLASNFTLSAVSVEEAGEASGVNNTIRQVGATLGSAIIGAILLSVLATNLVTGINGSPNIPDNIKTQLASAANTHTSNIEFGTGLQSLANIPKSLGPELAQITRQATTDANKTTMLFSLLFAALGFVISFWLPNIKSIETEESLAHKHTPVAPGKLHVAFRAAVALVIATLGAGGGYALAKYQDRNKTNDQNTTTTSQVVMPPSPGRTEDFTNNRSETPTASSTVPVLTDTPAPPPVNSTPPPVTPRTYINQTLGFSVQIPSDWKILSESADEVIFSNPQKIRYSIQAYSVRGDLEFMKAQTRQVPYISNVNDATFANRAAFSFQISGIYKTGYAILIGGQLYYIMGPDVQHSPLTSFVAI